MIRAPVFLCEISMRFRPCIDLHDGQVKQIVGSTLRDDAPEALRTNFVAEKPLSWFVSLYQKDNLQGGHIIKLGPGNDEAARKALGLWPLGMQVGGAIHAENAADWLDAGASHVIVTSAVFSDGQIDREALSRLVKAVGKEHLVLDLSCRKCGNEYYIATDRWQKISEVALSAAVLDNLAASCDEFLVHAADVEGKCAGIEHELVALLAAGSPIPVTYAGGVRSLEDMALVQRLGQNRVDVTIGSALDIFGGSTIRYQDAVTFAATGNAV